MTPEEYEKLIESIGKEFTNNPLDNRIWEIKSGKTNRITGLSGFKHQIDVSLACENEIVLIECKKWNSKNRITVAEYLVLLGRIYDISKLDKGKNIRGAIVTTTDWQKGVKTLYNAYGDKCSLFKVNTIGEIRNRLHTAFISGSCKMGLTLKDSALRDRGK